MIRKTLAIASLLAASAVIADDAAPAFDAGTISGLGVRNIGSAAMSGRIASLDATTLADGKLALWVGAASGGVWKSLDSGTTFKPVFAWGERREFAVRAALGRPQGLILLTGPTMPQSLPDSVKAFPYLPYSTIFPRAAAVVHQAGIGTLAQAMRAGRPDRFRFRPCEGQLRRVATTLPRAVVTPLPRWRFSQGAANVSESPSSPAAGHHPRRWGFTNLARRCVGDGPG